MQLLRSLLFTSFFFGSTLIYSILVVLASGLSDERRFAIAHHWSRTQLWMLKTVCGLRYQVEGREHIPAQGCHVSMWKHSSTWETIAQASLLPPQSWVLKRELMWIPIVGWALGRLKPIAIDRKAVLAAANQIVAVGKQRLADGLWVLIFPEGTRVPAGERRRYGASGALLASQAGCQILPVAHNAGYFWPRRGWLKKPGIITVRFGPPIDASGRDPRELNREVQAWIEAALDDMPKPGQAV
ncbi:1-acyl-sn-glycerol-3-phosphate acyltransferase [Steroidobacter denitrificans]|uniref:1-acyl-sn-glycerol-3-phosphate acyltransferase n=1 Tax=Steroidobacter denitrificans TaxID=465721 RepID=A0A127FDM5_STEDE|nr:lysophospholipid acyltransferase family protein [Steroidobacter denitrificans]AMN48477.1 1-acyl-sn-glycerol-3-phosphate acyltransferase [Steroidobacter denitrificans]